MDFRVLIKKANADRLETIRKIESALWRNEKPDVSPLTLVAPRAQSLGFSDHDLRYFRGYYENRQEMAMAFVTETNVKSQRNGCMAPEVRSQRDKVYRRATVAGSLVRILNDELGRREIERLNIEREKLKNQPVEASKPEPVVEVPKPIKRHSKTTFKAPSKKYEFKKTVKSFEELKNIVVTAKPMNRILKAEVLSILSENQPKALIKECRESGKEAKVNGIIAKKVGATVSYYRQ